MKNKNPMFHGAVAAYLIAGLVVAGRAEGQDENSGASTTSEVQPATSEPSLQTIAVDPTAPENQSASEQASAPGIGIAEIIVTAQKREQDINDVPISISAYSGDTLSDLGVRDTQSLSRLVPGFNANENGGQSTIFTLRGVGFNDTTYTATGTVGVYVDEVGLPYSSMTRGPVVDLQRVEVLKGPQGTLYGRNTTGGLINYLPNRPTDSFQIGTTTSYGRFETLDSEGFVSGPLTETLRGRLAIRYVGSGEGWQESQTRPDDYFGAQKKWSGRGTLEWTPSNDWDVKLAVEGWKTSGQPSAAQALYRQAQNPFVGELGQAPAVRNYPYDPDTKNPQQADWDPDYHWRIDDQFLMQSLKTNWHLSDTMTLTGIYSHLRVEADGSDAASSGLNVRNLDSRLFAHIETHALELRLADEWWDGRLKWTIGTNLSRDKGVENRFADVETLSSFFPGPIPLPEPLPGNVLATQVIYNGQPEIDQSALFVNTDYLLTDTLNLTLAARYTKNDQHFVSCSIEATGGPQPDLLGTLFTVLSARAAAQYTLTTGMLGRPSVVVPGECLTLQPDGSNEPFVSDLNESNVSGRVALSKTLDSGNLLYASVSRGFKAGGFPVLSASSTLQLEPAVQEQLIDYEIGTKVSMFDQRLHFDLGAYYYSYKDKQLLTRRFDELFGPLGVLRNAPRSHIYGTELAIQTTPVQGLYLAVAASWLKTQIDEFVSTSFTGDEVDFSGKPFNFAPQVQVSAISDYTFPLTSRLNLGIGIDYTYGSETNGTLEEDPNYDMDAYSIFGSRLHLDSADGVWSLFAFVHNLTNELVNIGAFNFGDTVTRYVGPPRIYGLGFTYVYE